MIAAAVWATVALFAACALAGIGKSLRTWRRRRQAVKDARMRRQMQAMVAAEWMQRAAEAEEHSERLWADFDRPRPPYPDWYRPEDDAAAPFGKVRRGAGAQRYFARNMHDHRRGASKCPACRGGQRSGDGL